MKIRVEKIVNLFIDIFYVVLVFFIPLFFGILLKTNNVFELNKIIIFKILIILLGVFSIAKIFFEKKKIVIFKSIYKNKLFWPFFIFIILLLISTIFSVNREVSFFGDYDRQQGFLTYIYYFALFFITILNINTKEKINNILKIAVLSSFFVSIYAIAQSFGFDPISWNESSSVRAVSTLGQPNYLGAYLVMLIPLSLYFVKKEENKYFKFSFIIIFLLQTLALFFTYSMSSWIAFSLLLFTFFVYLVYKKKKLFSSHSRFPADWEGKSENSEKKGLIYKKNKLFLSVFVAFVTIFFLSLIFNNDWLLKNKVSSLFNISEGSSSARVDFWKASLKAIKEKPFLGYGLDTQGEVLVKYYEKSWGVHSNVGVQPNRAHNFILDILLTSGLIGLFAYLFFLYFLFKILLDNIKENKNKDLSLAIFFSLIAYLVTLLFNFTFIVGEVYFFLFFAIAYIINKNYSVFPDTIRQTDKRVSLNILFSVLFIILFYITVIPLCKNQIQTMEADHYFWQIRVSRQYNEFSKSLELYSYIDDLNINNSYYKRAYAYLLTDWIVEMDKLGRVYRFMGEKVLNKILASLDKQNYEDNLLRAKIYSVLANEENQVYFEKASDNFKKAIKESPQMPTPYRELAKMYFKKGDYDLAIENFNISNSKLPDTNNPYLNLDHKNIVKREMIINYLGLGDSYKEKGDEVKSKEYYDLALSLSDK